MRIYCAHCGEEFEPTERDEEFCSWDCAEAAADEDADNDTETAFYQSYDEEED